MLTRFQGDSGRRLRVEALTRQKMVDGDRDLATRLADLVELIEVPAGTAIITENAPDNDLFLVLVGRFDIIVKGTVVKFRVPNDHVGEMAAIEPQQLRSATVIATEPSVVAKLSEPDLNRLGEQYPSIYRCFARELAHRLRERNDLVAAKRQKIRVFIISSSEPEALEVARLVQNAFDFDSFATILWTDGVFKLANYALETLEAQVDDSDFAIAIAHGDDLTTSRRTIWPAPRDNVIFELGLFMGRLGRKRAILMEPRDEGVKLPSDLRGITTVTYRYEKGKDAAARMAPACNNLREHILELGPKHERG